MSLYNVPVIAIIVICLVRLFKKIRYEYTRWQTYKLIPGPEGNFFLGNRLNLITTPENVFKIMFERGLKYYPIMKAWTGFRHCVNIMSPEDMEVCLTHTKNIKKSRVYNFLQGWLGTGLLTSTGKKWQTRRKILTPAFHFNVLQEFLNIFNEETENLVKVINERDDKSEIDVVSIIAQFTLQSIKETAMGTKESLSPKEELHYKEAIIKIGNIIMHRTPRPWLHVPWLYRWTETHKREKELIDTLHYVSYKVINQRKKNFVVNDTESDNIYTRKRLAMLDLLLSYKAKGADIDEEGIREEVDTFMFEGHDTTAVCLSYALMVIANHKDVQDGIVQELNDILGDSKSPPTFSDLQNMNYLERCLKEVLRLYPSVPIITRETVEGFRTKTGYTIQQGDELVLNIYAMHHSPHVYPDPEKFDPNRFLPENCQERHPFAYVPFSAGPRNCIGQKYAMLELKSAMCGILRNFELKPVDTPKDIVFIADLVLRPANKIRVNFVPRNNI